MHGGSASQVEDKAQECLNEIADSMATDAKRNLEDLQDEYDATDDPEKKLEYLSEMRKYLKIVLDRTEHGPTETQERTGEGGGPIEYDIIRTVVETDEYDE